MLAGAKVKCRVFAGTHRNGLYPNLPVEDSAGLEAALEHTGNVTVIYRWCDGWAEIDKLLKKLRRPIVLRWHNNTPPWFFPSYSLDITARTLMGSL
jgi:hypothetical protein